MINLDSKDKKILYELDKNSRIGYSALGKKVRLSKEVVRYRILKLEQEKVIQKHLTVIDTGKLGFVLHKFYFIFQNTTEEIENEIIEYIKNREDTVWFVSMDGKYNIVFYKLQL